MMKTEALQLALEALEKISMGGDPRRADLAITAIKATLEAKDEPVAWLHRFIEGGISINLKPLDLERHPERWEPLYATPPQRTWVGLTDEERGQVYADWRFNGGNLSNLELCRAIEAKLKEKNT
jgi:hypothetical protein